MAEPLRKMGREWWVIVLSVAVILLLNCCLVVRGFVRVFELETFINRLSQ